jgi:signal transduction histidine kinase
MAGELPEMNKDPLLDDTNCSHTNGLPACQWTFDRTRRFHHIGGDSVGLFERPAAELLRRPVTMIDDPQGRWAARLDRLFSEKIPFEEWTASISGIKHALVQIALPAADGVVTHTAGFAYRDGTRLPPVAEMELAARAVLQVLETERARTTRFLHDVVAQCLSGTGLQLELLQLELQAHDLVLPDRLAAMQRALEEALQQVREFSAKDPARPLTES